MVDLVDTRIEKLKIAEIPQYVLEAIAKELAWYLVGFTRIHEDKNVIYMPILRREDNDSIKKTRDAL